MKTVSKIKSNAIREDILRKVQMETLEYLKSALEKSFGPYGSNTIIAKQNVALEFTKDGHTILSNIQFLEPIEYSVKECITDLTRRIVIEVGDGTTSAVILSEAIFRALYESKVIPDKTPFDIIHDLQKACENINKLIKAKAKEFTIEDAWYLTMISTNGNKSVADSVYTLYKDYGLDVYVDVQASPTEESMVKIYDGLTINKGYCDSAYINTAGNKCIIDNPRIYMFEHAIDTPEMGTFMSKIIIDNIITPMQDTTSNYVPTVIIAPKISSDFDSYMRTVADELGTFPMEERPPICIITNTTTEEEKLLDLGLLAGCREIKKYINPETQEADIANGLAPTPYTIHEFAGTCTRFEASSSKCKFINPAKMLDENGEYSSDFVGLLDYLEMEYTEAKNNGKDSVVKATIKRRIQSLKSNMVDFFVGGVNPADRDALRALVEDAILNCRASAAHGYGYASNVEGLLASDTLCKENDSELGYMYEIIFAAYSRVLETLFRVSKVNDITVEDVITEQRPYNVKTKEFDDKVITSITTDIVILETISKIVSLMYTSNQFLSDSMATTYADRIED